MKNLGTVILLEALYAKVHRDEPPLFKNANAHRAAWILGRIFALGYPPNPPAAAKEACSKVHTPEDLVYWDLANS